MLAGSLRSAGRYEVHLLALGPCTLMVWHRRRVAAFVETLRLPGCIAVCLTALVPFAGYAVRTAEDKPASQTLHVGSFQLRRFIADDYRRPFAIARPGLVKFHDPHTT